MGEWRRCNGLNSEGIAGLTVIILIGFFSLWDVKNKYKKKVDELEKALTYQILKSKDIKIAKAYYFQNTLDQYRMIDSRKIDIIINNAECLADAYILFKRDTIKHL